MQMTVIPDSVDPIVGYRFWREYRGRLLSQVFDSRWTPGKVKEAADISSDLFFGPGIHAFKLAEFIGWYTYVNGFDLMGLAPDYSIAGEIYLWGHVEEFAEGYRAQYGYPKCLYIHPSRKADIVELAELYQIDIKEGPCNSPDTLNDGTSSPLKSQLDAFNQQYLQSQLFQAIQAQSPTQPGMIIPYSFLPGSKP